MLVNNGAGAYVSCVRRMIAPISRSVSTSRRTSRMSFKSRSAFRKSRRLLKCRLVLSDLSIVMTSSIDREELSLRPPLEVVSRLGAPRGPSLRKEFASELYVDSWNAAEVLLSRTHGRERRTIRTEWFRCQQAV